MKYPGVWNPVCSLCTGIDLSEDGFLKANIVANTGDRSRRAEIWLLRLAYSPAELMKEIM